MNTDELTKNMKVIKDHLKLSEQASELRNQYHEKIIEAINAKKVVYLENIVNDTKEFCRELGLALEQTKSDFLAHRESLDVKISLPDAEESFIGALLVFDLDVTTHGKLTQFKVALRDKNIKDAGTALVSDDEHNRVKETKGIAEIKAEMQEKLIYWEKLEIKYLFYDLSKVRKDPMEKFRHEKVSFKEVLVEVIASCL